MPFEILTRFFHNAMSFNTCDRKTSKIKTFILKIRIAKKNSDLLSFDVSKEKIWRKNKTNIPYQNSINKRIF